MLFLTLDKYNLHFDPGESSLGDARWMDQYVPGFMCKNSQQVDIIKLSRENY
jgi:hypothetical protein